ncbi:RHS repeat-associated core domain-containing protein [Tissierella sp.]|uniref:RHS repeat domain-containing protein n=1 Tax=Tissierella sp. TaxID=41274 RepID=UPI0028B162F3|nr:RHS repeat-associated core domain-containing protein [Tissierella sp.]
MKAGENATYYFGKLSIITDYGYDSRGNLIQKRTTESNNKLGQQIVNYRYNISNQLIETINNKGQRTTYTYSPTGLRDTKTTDGNTIGYYYDRGNVIIETENGILKARNLRGHQLISREENNDKAYYLFNGHGDVATLIDKAGEIIANYEYDIYELEKLAEESIISNPYRYSGEYYDEETGLYYLIARYYDPELGRFISEDTYKGDILDPLTLNYYIYCNGNPIKYIDPSGNAGELTGKLYELGEIITAIGKIAGTGYKLSKEFTPVGIFGVIVSKPTYAGETETDLKNDKEFQKWINGGGTSDPNKGNNKKNKRDNKQDEKHSLKKFKNNKEANKMAKKFGYDGAEDLKEAFVGKDAISKFNMHYDTKTGEIILVLIQDTGIKLSTGLFK